LMHNWHVTDFISLGNFAVFNVADASISIGTAILVLWMWYKDRKEKQAASASEDAGSDISRQEITPKFSSEEPVGE
jgi:signal peptidase II